MKKLALLIFLLPLCILSQPVLDFVDSSPGSASGWKSQNTKYGSAKSESGKMVLNNSSDFMYWYDTPYHFFMDSVCYFEIDFKMTKIVGDYGNGLYFHVGNFDYEFWITPNAFYKMRVFDSNENQDSLSGWVKHSGIKQGVNALNTIGVECRYGDISVYINGTKVNEYRNGKLLKNNPPKYTAANVFYRQRTSVFRIAMSVCSGETMEVTRFASSHKPKTRHIHLIENPNQGLKKENLGPMINTSCEELNPVVSADDKQLYFSIRECSVPGTNSRTDDDMYYSTRDSGGSWKHFKKLGSPFNNQESSSMISISGDNNTIYYKAKYSGKSSKAWFAQRKSETSWSSPQAFTVSEYKELNRYSGRTISANRKVMISYLEEANSMGNLDIYVSFSEDGINFSRPKNLGSMVNTPLSEFGVFLAPDNKTLYFSSYGHAGYGSSDIFVTRRLDDTWTKWSRPENLGPEINTSDWDAYFTVIASGKAAYMVSSKNGTGGSSDIVRIELPQAARPDPVVLVKGRVLDAKTKKPLFAEVVSTALRTNTKALIGHSDSASGAYQIILPAGELYDFLATKGGYYSNSQSIDLTNVKDYIEIVKDIYLQPVDSPGTVHLNNIYFKDCSDTILQESYAELNRLADYMKSHPEYDADIDLLMDKGGECPEVDVLKDKRSEAIRKYLLKKGVEEKHLKHKKHHNNPEIKKPDPVLQDSLHKQYVKIVPETENKTYTKPNELKNPTHVQVRFVANKSHKHYKVRKQL